MGIAYDAPSNTITVTGYTSGTPCTFTDIYNADQAGGPWGVVSKQGTNQFEFAAKLVVGDGGTATYFNDTDKQVVFTTAVITAAGQKCIDVTAAATFWLGTLVSTTNCETKQGCILLGEEATSWCFLLRNSGGTIYLYSSTFKSYGATHIVYQPDRAWNCHFSRKIDLAVGTSNIYNVVLDGEAQYIETPSGSGYIITIDKVHFIGTSSYLRLNTDDSVTVNNLYGRSCSGNGFLVQKVQNTYCVDNDFDNWTFTWTLAGTVYRQYTVNVKVVSHTGNPISGATVTLKDKDNTQIFSVATAANGSIAEQTVSRGYYTQATGNTLQDYSPHTLTISATGYDTYKQILTLSEPVDWEIALSPTVTTTVSGGGAARGRRVKIVEPNYVQPLLKATSVLLIQKRRLQRLLNTSIYGSKVIQHDEV